MATIVVGDGIQPATYASGNKPAKTINNHLLMEDGYYVLTENGERIIISYTFPDARPVGLFAVSGSWLPGDMI